MDSGLNSFANDVNIKSPRMITSCFFIAQTADASILLRTFLAGFTVLHIRRRRHPKQQSRLMRNFEKLSVQKTLWMNQSSDSVVAE